MVDGNLARVDGAEISALLRLAEGHSTVGGSAPVAGRGFVEGRAGFMTTDALRVLMKNCARNHDVARAEDIVRFLEASGHQPCKEFYDILIHACAQAKDVPRAEMHFERMAALGLERTEESYNSIINACAAAGDGDRATHWLFRMTDAGMAPNGITYGTLCKALGQHGRIQDIESIMGMVERDGLPVNEYFYASLITACGVAQPPDTQRALLAFAEVLDRGLKPKSVKTVLQRVLGETLVAQLFQVLSQGQPISGQEMLTRARQLAAGAAAKARLQPVPRLPPRTLEGPRPQAAQRHPQHVPRQPGVLPQPQQHQRQQPQELPHQRPKQRPKQLPQGPPPRSAIAVDGPGRTGCHAKGGAAPRAPVMEPRAEDHGPAAFKAAAALASSAQLQGNLGRIAAQTPPEVGKASQTNLKDYISEVRHDAAGGTEIVFSF